MTHKHRKKLIHFIFLKCWMHSLLRAEVLACSLDISKLQFLIKQIFHLYIFLQFLVVKTMDPDSMHSDSQLCILVPLVSFCAKVSTRSLSRRMLYFTLVL
jgi:hypothetical protein